MLIPDTAPLLAIAILLDAIIGDPHWFYQRVPHPTVGMGWIISTCDRAFNWQGLSGPVKKLLGAVTILILIGLMVVSGILVSTGLSQLTYGFWLEAVAVSLLISQNSLYRHVADVALAMSQNGLAGGRMAVSRIVGRDPENLDQPGVNRAAIESLAENFSDGIIAPIFWGLLFGLPGILAYKALNTADSMIGHLTDKYRDFGWAAARLDDVANYLPARIAGYLIALAGMAIGSKPMKALHIMHRDGSAHRSVNAGYPEAAMAAALGIKLAGPRHYKDVEISDAWLGDGREDAGIDDIRRGLVVYVVACVILAVTVVVIATATT